MYPSGRCLFKVSNTPLYDIERQPRCFTLRHEGNVVDTHPGDTIQAIEVLEIVQTQVVKHVAFIFGDSPPSSRRDQLANISDAGDIQMSTGCSGSV
jgi:hypothetical protein